MRRSFAFGVAGFAALLAHPSVGSEFSVVPAPETVTVTATRTGEEPIAITGASVTVIPASELETQQTVALIDVLKQVPSLVVTRNGGIGQPASISLRGAEAGQTVVLIDGVRVNDPSTTDDSAAAALGDLLANSIDRVEVLRGPQSTLYGSDAIGGVVDIVTKRGGSEPFALDATAEGGSFGTAHGNVASHGTAGMLDYGAGLNYLSTTGISAADSHRGNHENDGYTNYGATLNARLRLNEDISADLRGYYTHGHDRFDDGFGGPPLFRVADSAANNTNEIKTLYAGLNADAFGAAFHNRFAFIATEGDRSFFDSASDPATHLNFQYGSSTTRFEYQGIVDVTDEAQLTFGAETQESTFRNDNFGAFAFFSPPHVVGHDRISGGYAQVLTTLFEQLTLTGGVRYDSDDVFGSHTSWKINAAWNVPEWDLTLRGNAGNAFKAPSLFQDFGPNSNPLSVLKPETATGWEAGFDKRFELDDVVLQGSATYFARNTHNQIDFQNCFTPDDAPGCPERVDVFGYYENLDKTRATGVELMLNARLLDDLSTALTYTNMTAKNVVTGTGLARRPQNLGSASMTWHPLDAATLGASLAYQGPRFDDQGNFTRLSANTRVNLFGAYDVTEQWQLFGRIDNLFNDRTEEVAGYGVSGTGAFVGVRAKL